jgi:hypothetical protein
MFYSLFASYANILALAYSWTVSGVDYPLSYSLFWTDDKTLTIKPLGSLS